MGLLTKGPINVRLYKLRTKIPLTEIYESAKKLRYPLDPEHQSTGWGGSWDSNEHVKESLKQPFVGGTPDLVDGDTGVTRRLRLRFYWDAERPDMKRFFGTQSDWRDFHQREAFDVVIFDGGESGEHSVLVSAREDRLVKPVIIPALTALITDADPGATVSSDLMPEALDSDFYLWLLYFHKHQGGLLSTSVKITDINEIESSDRQRRSGKFGAGAGADRIELLALIAKNQAKFGPAKFSVRFELAIEADLDLHVFPDGGYSVFKTSEYKDHRAIPANMLGHKLVEDVFELVLPSIRSLYNYDNDWRSRTRDEFIRRSKVELDAVSKT